MTEPKLLKTHEGFMSKALSLAAQAEALGEVPVGALIVLGGEIVASGLNQKESRSVATRHAEIEAIENASQALGRWRLSDCDLYVTLEPCFMCAGAILSARLKSLVFGCKDPKGGAIVSLYQLLDDPRSNHSCHYTQGVLEDQCSQILKTFFKTKRGSKK